MWHPEMKLRSSYRASLKAHTEQFKVMHLVTSFFMGDQHFSVI